MSVLCSSDIIEFWVNNRYVCVCLCYLQLGELKLVILSFSLNFLTGKIRNVLKSFKYTSQGYCKIKQSNY